MATFRQLADEAINSLTTEHLRRYAHHGSMIALDYRDPRVADSLIHPDIRSAFTRLGLADVRWLSGYVIGKPAHSPALWWHQDWWAWNEDVSHAPLAPQIFLMVYLDDTSPENGCLRVIPGSHRRGHFLHGVLPPAHGEEMERLEADHPAYAHQNGERDVPVRAGDLVVGDARLLHATHPNRTDKPRRCVTLWYLPDFSRLPAGFRHFYSQHPSQPPAGACGKDAPSAALIPWLPDYQGPPAPAPEFNRSPSPRAGA
ncbi:phytanoyl-CoA dioxygenase family protein [Streptomyces sp. NPDC003077]|uniref:phytanoyl-CoA dioxygenase family protein n=1 Tax=Streptomyces sp. NPDC003077 TaxID=3154443 RepID=UPI0033BCBCB4